MKSDVNEMADTWWGKVIDFFGGELLINNSCSGSRVTKLPFSEILFPSGCSNERTSALHIGAVTPDVIIVYLGTNDWAYGANVGYETHVLDGEEYNDIIRSASNLLSDYSENGAKRGQAPFSKGTGTFSGVINNIHIANFGSVM